MNKLPLSILAQYLGNDAFIETDRINKMAKIQLRSIMLSSQDACIVKPILKPVSKLSGIDARDLCNEIEVDFVWTKNEGGSVTIRVYSEKESQTITLWDDSEFSICNDDYECRLFNWGNLISFLCSRGYDMHDIIGKGQAIKKR